MQQFALVAVLCVTVAGFGWLYRLRLGQGDSFPRYSSMRSDAFGTRALYDSLESLPGISVSRRFEPLSDLEAQPSQTIILAGLWHGSWKYFPEEEARALDRAMKAGCRVVFAFAGAYDAPYTSPGYKKPVDPDEKKQDDKKDEEKKEDDADHEDVVHPADLQAMWSARVLMRWRIEDAARTREAPAAMPATLHWNSDTIFELSGDTPWRVLYRRAGEPVIAERKIGRGSIVLFGDAYFISNEALQRDRATGLLTWLVGPNTTVVFDESHLGVEKQHGVAELARSYGLAGALLAFIVAAIVFIWHRSALFVPPAVEAREIALHYNQTAGLEALLRRAISRGELVGACAAEWRKSARPVDSARADAAIAAASKDTPPVTLYNSIVRALRRR